MRCEICNRSMTDVFLDGEGKEHEYCIDCIDEIQDALEGFDEEDENTWYDELFEPYDDEVYEDFIEEDQDYSYLDGT